MLPECCPSAGRAEGAKPELSLTTFRYGNFGIFWAPPNLTRLAQQGAAVSRPQGGSRPPPVRKSAGKSAGILEALEAKIDDSFSFWSVCPGAARALAERWPGAAPVLGPAEGAKAN